MSRRYPSSNQQQQPPPQATVYVTPASSVPVPLTATATTTTTRATTPVVGRGWRIWSSIRDRPSWHWWAAGGAASVVSIWSIYRWRQRVRERQLRASHTQGLTQADLAFSMSHHLLPHSFMI
jgi:hypothetical protein